MKAIPLPLLWLAALLFFSNDVAKGRSGSDSLWNVWHDESQADTNRLKALHKIIWNGYLYSQPDSAFHLAQRAYDFASKRDLKKQMGLALNIQGVSFRIRGDFPKALEYYQRCYDIREEIGDKKGAAGSLNNIGLVYYNQGLYPKALEHYQRSLRIYEEIADRLGVADVLNNIGIIHVNTRDKSKALEYLQRSLEIYEEFGDQKAIADCRTNIGNIYQDQGDHLKALQYHQESLVIYEDIGDRKGVADCLINIGLTHKSMGDLQQALVYLQNSRDVYEQLGDRKGVADCLTGIGTVFGIQGNHGGAIRECQRGLTLSDEMGVLSIQRDACKCLYDAYKALGNRAKALEFHERMLVLNDSLQTEETARQLERIEFQKQMFADSLRNEEEKLKVQIENDKRLRNRDRTRNMALAGGACLLLLAGGLYGRMRYIRKSKAIIEQERDRSESLLLNILPAEIANELKAKGRAEARDFDRVSILFTDFKEFTKASEKLSARALVDEINVCFEAFDAICDTYGIEKIKTIGDAYMAAGGLPVPDETAAKRTVSAALEMQRYIVERKVQQERQGHTCFEMRAGVHTGPVVAGIAGTKKFQYDVWGDTVNTASRMESNSEVGRVNISQDTYALIKDDPDFTFEPRGKLQVKGKGEVEMYFVASRS